MKYNKKQRREIYLKAYHIIEQGRFSNICGAIDKARGNNYFDCEEVREKFNEFALFDPHHKSAWWFDNREERLMCLLLCAEMCN